MNKNKFLALAMAGAMTLAAAVPAYATVDSGTTTVHLAVAEATYELVIPTTLTVTKSGYNAFSDGVTVKNLTNGEGVTSIDVTATSANDWSLKDTSDNKISYILAANEAQGTEETTYSFTDTTAMATENGSTIACGVNVSDYSGAAAGDYSDTITWTAEVKKTTTKEVTLCSVTSASDWYYDGMKNGSYKACTTDNVTYTYGEYDASNFGFKNGTFSTTDGVITKIVISSDCTISATGTGWTLKNGKTATWSGTKAASVDFAGSFTGSFINVVVTVER